MHSNLCLHGTLTVRSTYQSWIFVVACINAQCKDLLLYLSPTLLFPPNAFELITRCKHLKYVDRHLSSLNLHIPCTNPSLVLWCSPAFIDTTLYGSLDLSWKHNKEAAVYFYNLRDLMQICHSRSILEKFGQWRLSFKFNILFGWG